VAIRDALPELEHVLVRDVGYEDWLARQFAVDPDPAIDPEHYFIIRHTGGTTGKPKGVAHTHRGWLAAAATGSTSVRRSSRAIRACIWRRSVTARAISSRRSGWAVPTMLNTINRIPGIERLKFPDLKCMMVSAAPISGETALKPTRFSETPCIRGMGKPKYYLLR
jgi:acyl-CoA synthetase (AMP-forming)/AMP-acid ligase II